MTASATRVERDSMGEMPVPADALYGASTMRAVLNFPISDLRFPRQFIRALGLIKLAAARTNTELGVLDATVGDAIVAAAQEVADGQHDAHFVLDIFQTGSGTSTNANANEVIANRASQLLAATWAPGWYTPTIMSTWGSRPTMSSPPPSTWRRCWGCKRNCCRRQTSLPFRALTAGAD